MATDESVIKMKITAQYLFDGAKQTLANIRVIIHDAVFKCTVIHSEFRKIHIDYSTYHYQISPLFVVKNCLYFP